MFTSCVCKRVGRRLENSTGCLLWVCSSCLYTDRKGKRDVFKLFLPLPSNPLSLWKIIPVFSAAAYSVVRQSINQSISQSISIKAGFARCHPHQLGGRLHLLDAGLGLALALGGPRGSPPPLGKRTARPPRALG